MVQLLSQFICFIYFCSKCFRLEALLNEESVEQGEEKVASKGNVEHEEEVQIVGEVCKTQHDEGGGIAFNICD